MAKEDIFGYDVDVKGRQVVSAHNASLDLGGGRIALVQNISGNYTHKVNPVFEAGSSSVYFVNGQPQGSLSYTALVGTDGWFSGMSNSSGTCATLRNMGVTISGSGSDCDVTVASNASVRFKGILQAVEFMVSTQDLQISNSGTFMCTDMSFT